MALSKEEKMFKMYQELKGDINPHSEGILAYQEDTKDRPARLVYIKGNAVVWTITDQELLFNYMTRDLT